MSGSVWYVPICTVVSGGRSFHSWHATSHALQPMQVDVSTSYQISEKVNVYLEALNITNDTLSTHGRFDNQLLDVFAYGRRYALGARVRL